MNEKIENLKALLKDDYLDGTLPDIVVMDTNLEQWKRWFSALVKTYKVTTLGDILIQSELPDDIFTREDKGCRIKIGDTIGICHFFGEDRIEFDIDPREFKKDADYAGLIDAMELTARVVQKPVHIIEEGGDVPIFTIVPK